MHQKRKSRIEAVPVSTSAMFVFLFYLRTVVLILLISSTVRFRFYEAAAFCFNLIWLKILRQSKFFLKKKL